MTEESINHPIYYGGDTVYETIKVLAAWFPNGIPFAEGNAIKYLSRAGKKGSYVEDLEKAKWYINYAIQQHKKTAAEIEDRIYQENVREWIDSKNCLNLHVVIQGERVVGIYETKEEAYESAVKELGTKTHFMLRQIQAKHIKPR